jgi:hypothetical protein
MRLSIIFIMSSHYRLGPLDIARTGRSDCSKDGGDRCDCDCDTPFALSGVTTLISRHYWSRHFATNKVVVIAFLVGAVVHAASLLLLLQSEFTLAMVVS